MLFTRVFAHHLFFVSRSTLVNIPKGLRCLICNPRVSRTLARPSGRPSTPRMRSRRSRQRIKVPIWMMESRRFSIFRK